MVCSVFSLESPHRGDSNEYTHNTTISLKKSITRNYLKYNNVCGFGIIFVRDSERVRNSCVKRANSVRATEVLYCICICLGLYHFTAQGLIDVRLSNMNDHVLNRWIKCPVSISIIQSSRYEGV